MSTACQLDSFSTSTPSRGSRASLPLARSGRSAWRRGDRPASAVVPPSPPGRRLPGSPGQWCRANGVPSSVSRFHRRHHHSPAWSLLAHLYCDRSGGNLKALPPDRVQRGESFGAWREVRIWLQSEPTPRPTWGSDARPTFERDESRRKWRIRAERSARWNWASSDGQEQLDHAERGLGGSPTGTISETLGGKRGAAAR